MICTSKSSTISRKFVHYLVCQPSNLRYYLICIALEGVTLNATLYFLHHEGVAREVAGAARRDRMGRELLSSRDAAEMSPMRAARFPIQKLPGARYGSGAHVRFTPVTDHRPYWFTCYLSPLVTLLAPPAGHPPNDTLISVHFHAEY